MFRNVTRVVLLLAASGMAGSVAAKEDLLTVYRQAVGEDRALRAAAAELEAAREAIPQARARLLPNAGLNAEAGTNYADPEGSGSDDYQDYSLGLRLTQPLYRRDDQLRQGQAASSVSEAEASYAATEQDLIVRTARGYFDVLTELANLQFVRADKEAIARQLEQTRQRFEVGLIAITDVHEAQARYDNVLFEEIRAQNDVDNAREALRVITAAYHGELADLAAELPLKRPEPGNIDDWVAAAQRDNLSLVAARHGVEVAREEIGIQRAAQLPTVDAIAAYAHSDDNADRLGGGRLDYGRVGLELNLPLYTGGAIDSRARQAEARFLQASELLEQARRSVERQTRDAYRNVNAAISGVEALRQAVVSNQSALDATQAGFEVGTRTIVDVLDAQRDLFRAQRDYDLARYAYVLSTLTLQQAVGSLGGDDVEQVNRLLE